VAHEESEEEWFEDFGARFLDADAVEALLERARSSGDRELRHLVKEVMVWRRIAPLLLERVVAAGAPIDEADAFLKYARFVIRGEGAAGAG